MKKMLLAALIVSFLSGSAFAAAAEESLMADLVFFNGKVFTVEKGMPCPASPARTFTKSSVK